MGFGHRVYKAYDPRASIIKEAAHDVFAVTGKNPLLDVALELERIALGEEYFVSRNLYPNVDFYSGLIYEAIGFPVEMFPVLFAIPRSVGWLAQWQEMLEDREQKIARPRQGLRGERRAELPADRRAGLKGARAGARGALVKRIGVYGWGVVAPKSPNIEAFADNLASSGSWLDAFEGFGPNTLPRRGRRTSISGTTGSGSTRASRRAASGSSPPRWTPSPSTRSARSSSRSDRTRGSRRC